MKSPARSPAPADRAPWVPQANRRQRFPLRIGGRRLVLCLTSEPGAEPVEARAFVEERLSEALPISGFFDWGGRKVYFKAERFTPAAGRRYGLRKLFLRRPLPREREYRNLQWLRAHGFAAPAPLLAGAVYHRGIPVAQFLATEALEGARPFDAWSQEATADCRCNALRALASEVARLHERGFVHRDLFPRNILVPPAGRPPAFIDAWRGGPGFGLRGPAYDLACFFLFASHFLAPGEEELFLREYFANRPSLRRPEGFLSRAQRHWKRLRRVLERKPGRRRGYPLPAREWVPRVGRGDPGGNRGDN